MRLLSLGTYPAASPRHGGQVRVAALHQELREAGWIVKHIAVVPYQGYQGERGATDTIELSLEYNLELNARGKRTDVNAAHYITSHPRVLADLSDKIDAFRPDVITFEQPWLWPAFQAYLVASKQPRRFSIIYSSQNVESELLRSEAASASFNGEEVEQAGAIEQSLIQYCDGIIAVSNNDRSYFEKLNRNVLLAPNGILPMASPGGLEYWTQQVGGFQSAIFVGSAHEPNAEGFATCLCHPTLSYLAPNQCITVVGGVSNILSNNRTFRANLGTNLARLNLVGVQHEGGLSSLYSLAKVVLLPIVSGGGTNIKTAEAIYSRKKVVATPMALRGYEVYLDMPHVVIAEPGADFVAATVKALNAKENVELTTEQVARLDGLLLRSTLAPVAAWLEKQALRYQHNRSDKYEISVRSGIEQILLEGWHEAEGNGVWTSQRRSSIRLFIRVEEARGVAIALDVSAFVVDDNYSFAAVELDGELCASRAFRSGAERAILELHVPTAKISDQGFIQLSLVSSSVRSPLEEGISGDPRKLGLMLHGISVELGQQTERDDA